MRKITCDRCGSDLSKEDYTGYIAITYRNANPRAASIQEPENSAYADMDFCDDCIKEIEQFIAKKKTPVSRIKASTENKESKTKKVTKKSLDVGKVIALYNGGWKIKDIAGEMGRDPHSISQAVYRYKKENKEVGEGCDTQSVKAVQT